MQINISTRHGNLRQGFQQKIIGKVEKLPRIFERLTVVDVTVDLEHEEVPRVEMRVSVEHNRDFIAINASSTVMAAVDGTIHKLEQQLRKHKEKLKGRKVTGLKHQETPSEPATESD